MKTRFLCDSMSVKINYLYSVNMSVCSDFFETFQGLIHADMDLDIKAKEQLITLFFNLNLVRKHEIAFD